LDPTWNATFNPGVRGDIAVGYNITGSLAAELETGFMWDSMDKINGRSLSSINQSVDLYSIPILANVVYKFQTKSAWTPYVGVGVGGIVGMFDFKNSSTSYSDTDFTLAYQGEAGVKYALTKNASIGIAYKFLGTLNQRYYLSGIGDHITLDGVYIHGVFANFTWNF
jgi:opacity protein-like surface antigen